MLKQRVGRRIADVDIVHIPTFTARRFLEHHIQHKALELQCDTALVRFRAVARQFRVVRQKGVRFLVLVQLIAILNTKQGIRSDENASGVVRSVDAIDGRSGWQ